MIIRKYILSLSRTSSSVSVCPPCLKGEMTGGNDHKGSDLWLMLDIQGLGRCKTGGLRTGRSGQKVCRCSPVYNEDRI